MGKLWRRVLIAGFAIVMYFLVADIFASRLITGNMMISSEYPGTDAAKIAHEINEIIKPIIGATTKSGMVYNQWGHRLNGTLAGNNMANRVFLVGTSLFMLIAPIVVAIKEIIKGIKKQS